MFPVILFGCIGVGMAFAVRQMGGTVLQVCKKLLGSISIDFFAYRFVANVIIWYNLLVLWNIKQGC